VRGPLLTSAQDAMARRPVAAFLLIGIGGYVAMTGRSVLLVAIFHASFDASISELSSDIIPGSAPRSLRFSPGS
jgi:hypothetical protein